MPRRKPSAETPEASIEPTAPAETTAPKRGRRKPAEAAPEPEAVVAEEKKPRARRAKPVAEPEPVVPPVEETAPPAPRKRRTRAPQTASDGDVPQASAPDPAPDVPTVTEPAETPTKGRSRRKTPADDAPVEAVAAPQPGDATEDADERTAPRRSRSRRRGRRREDEIAEARAEIVGAAPPAAAEPVSDFAIEDEEGRVAISWRTSTRGKAKRRGRAQEVSTTPAPPMPEVREEPEAPRERPGRGRRGRGARQEAAATPTAAPKEPTPAPPKEEPRPVLPPRPVVAIPPDAPQVVLQNGTPVLVRDKRAYPAIWFFGSAQDEKRLDTVLEEIRLAAASGIHVHSLFVDLEVGEEGVESATRFAAYLLKKVLEVDPLAQVLFRTLFVAPRGWENRHPKARFSWLDGTLADPSVCDDKFWSVAARNLETFVRQLRMLGQNDHILGVHLDRGEWFYPENNGYDNSPAAKEKFRDWARTRYNDDVVSLRAAWFDGDADFKTISVPPFERAGKHGDRFMRTSRKDRRWVDYHLFLSDATVFRIGELANVVKVASDGYFLVGVSYGYSFEWSHPYSGHLSLGKLLRTPEIDFIAGPPSYRHRAPGETASFPCPIDSLALNGKLYVSEEDFKTSIGNLQEPDDFNPVIKTPQALESVHWRGAGAALAHGSGVCWMDLWGNGWLRTSSIWTRGSLVKDLLVRRTANPPAAPDVAVFIDERSLAYLADPTGFNLLVKHVRDAVLRSGLSAGFYLLSDLAHREIFPECKLSIFLNAWDMRPEYRSAIKSRLQRDGKVLFWLYLTGLFDGGRESLERVREITGIALRPQPFNSKSGTTILNRRHPLGESFDERHGVDGAQLEPSYFAIPEDATVLGEYSQTGLPSFVVREFSEGGRDAGWKSVFLGEPPVSPSLIRALAQMAGAHVWSYTEDVVHVRPPFLVVHATSSGPRTITLPEKWCAFDYLSETWIEEGRQIRYQAVHGSTHVFLVGPRHELEAFLSLDPDAMLAMDHLPDRRSDSVSFDAFNFDIPVIKLGEWMEGDLGEESVDDLFFWPKIEDVEEEEAPASDAGDEGERTGRRRRRRRKKGGAAPSGNGPRSSGGSSAEPPEEVNFVFRKRE